MADSAACPDCAVTAGQPHEDGCDVARCTVCGAQRIGCDHGSSEQGWGHIWTGEWPGDAEVREGLAADLNDLAIRGATGRLRWDGQRWQAPAAEVGLSAVQSGDAREMRRFIEGFN